MNTLIIWKVQIGTIKMTEEKKSKNPFIAAAMAADNPKVPGAKTAQIQQAKLKNQVTMKKPTTRSAGRGR